jgi:nucleolar MIF4G domain-containing protein 1
MSRQKNGTKLPHALQQELGLEQLSRNSRRNGLKSRKDQRKAFRIEKRQHTRGSKGKPFQRISREDPSEDASEAFFESPSEDDAPLEAAAIRKTSPVQAAPKSILRKPQARSYSVDEDLSESEGSTEQEYERLYRGDTPEIVLDAHSRSYNDRQAEEDADIAALEKRLGLKGKNSRGDDDGLSQLLGDTRGDGDDDETKKRKRDADEWLKSKRRKAQSTPDTRSRSTGSDTHSASGNSGSDSEQNSSDDDFSGFDSEHEPEKEPRHETPRIRENPYVAPVASGTPTAKYVPPSLRKAQNGDDQPLQRLRRQLQGHLNKLSEANLVSIVSEMEKLYRTNPRGEVTNTLIDLFLALFDTPSSLSNTFIILHAAFATAIYRVVGVDFGAQLLASLIDRFMAHHTTGTSTKEPLNLISLLSNLFTFSLVAAPIIYSTIRLLLDPLSDQNAELLLRLIRDCGPQLRTDDPSALRTIVTQTQQATTALQASNGPSQPLTVRTKFMLETITDLRNNKLRDSTANTGTSKEHITRMRKALGSLSTTRSLRATEPLRIDLADLADRDRKGKWWLVGASWKGHDTVPNAPSTDVAPLPQDSTNPDEAPDYTALARHLHLTTPLSQLIFRTIASSPNAVIAHESLLKLRLKNAQLPDLPRVLLHCAGAEPSPNPFYAALAHRLCRLGDKARRLAKAFEFALWAWLKRLDDDEGPADAEVGLQQVNNIASLYASLIYEADLNIAVLRILDLHLLPNDSLPQLWVEALLVRVFVRCATDLPHNPNSNRHRPPTEQRNRLTDRQDPKDVLENNVRAILAPLASTASQLVPRLRVFLRTHIRKTELARSIEEKKSVRRACRLAEAMLDGLEIERSYGGGGGIGPDDD